MKVNLQFYYIPVCRATTPLSPVKVNQLPLVFTPTAHNCVNVTLALELPRQMTCVVKENQFVKAVIALLSLCVYLSNDIQCWETLSS